MNIRRPSDIRRKSDKRDPRKKLFIAGGTVLFAAVIAGGVFAVKYAALFQVRSIVVLGVPDAYGQQIAKHLEGFLREHSVVFRFLGGRNMLAWGGNEDAFLAANPEIKELSIKKEYIKRAVIVTVAGREKFGVWCRQTGEAGQEHASTTTDDASSGDGPPGECFWFDTDGVLFARAPLIRSELFNRVLDSTGRSLTLRDTIMPDRLFRNLTRIFRLLEIAQINTKTLSLSDLALEQVEANSISDPRITFSLRFDPVFSLSAIDALKRSGEWKQLQYANFTVENKASYR